MAIVLRKDGFIKSIVRRICYGLFPCYRIEIAESDGTSRGSAICTHGITLLVTAVIVIRRFDTEIWVWYRDLAGHCGNIGRYVWEFGFEFCFHLISKKKNLRLTWFVPLK